jgi:hypothetical protein
VTTGGRIPAVTTTFRKILASLAVLGVWGGLLAFATFGALEDSEKYFPSSVLVDR